MLASQGRFHGREVPLKPGSPAPAQRREVVDVPGCGHWTRQDRPEAVTYALLDFLRAL
ncbi:hypothetical protein [Streptomyces sp. CoH27]|uniref:hypothetical protein n=1 Tax=Streptomyces sp. CoH27 TaxID=2875763 RepID=UPI001CD468DF|nr:hypothetical protein [Streptomyces sp. CoH27]